MAGVADGGAAAEPSVASRAAVAWVAKGTKRHFEGEEEALTSKAISTWVPCSGGRISSAGGSETWRKYESLTETSCGMGCAHRVSRAGGWG